MKLCEASDLQLKLTIIDQNAGEPMRDWDEVMVNVDTASEEPYHGKVISHLHAEGGKVELTISWFQYCPLMVNFLQHCSNNNVIWEMKEDGLYLTTK